MVCAAPVYGARNEAGSSDHLVPSRIVAWPPKDAVLSRISYVQLSAARVPVLVDRQPDGSVWLGGAYLDRIARELKLLSRPVPGMPTAFNP